jgi:hypothetical protein
MESSALVRRLGCHLGLGSAGGSFVGGLVLLRFPRIQASFVMAAIG